MSNQGSSVQQNGEIPTLNNNISVCWKKVTDCSYPVREGQCSCSLGNHLYVFGGVIQDGDSHMETNDLMQFNAVDYTWSLIDAKGKLPEPRSAASLVSVGKKLYLFGGLNQEDGWLDSLYIFDTETNTWSELETKGKRPSARDKLQGTVVDPLIYYFGGFGPVLSGEEEEWEDMEDESDDEDVIEEARTQQAAQFGWYNDLYCFDTVKNEWSQPMHMNLGVPTKRAAHGMCTVDQNLVIFGGRDTEKRTNDLHIFNVQTRKWDLDMKCKGQWPAPRSFHTTTAVGRRVVVTGGRGQDNNHHADFHIFDTETKEWLQPEVSGDLPKARGQHSVAVVGDKLVLYGGSSDFSPEVMACQKYYNDTYVLPIVEVLNGGAVVVNTDSNANGHSTQTDP